MVRMGGGICAILSLRRKYRRCCAFFAFFFFLVLVLRDQVRFSARWTPRNLVLLTTSTGSHQSSVGSGLFWGMIVLNVEWMSLWTAFLHNFIFQVDKSQMEWGGDGVISRVFGVVRKLKGVQCGGQQRLDVPPDQPLKALHDDGCECDGPVVIEAGHWGLLRHRDDGGGLETRRNNGAAHGDVKDVSEDIH